MTRQLWLPGGPGLVAQVEDFDYIDSHDGKAIIGDVRGLGKAQPVDAGVLTPSGWVQMGSLQPGDRVVGRDGNPANIAAVFPQGPRAIYKVSFSDNTSVECDDEHLWLTTYPTRKAAGYSSHVHPLKFIRRTLNSVRTDGQIDARHYIPITEPVNFPTQLLPIEPYLLGVLIGDGGMSQDVVMLSSADQQILDQVERLLPSPLRLKRRGTYDYALTTVKGQPNPLIRELKKLGLMGRKSEHKFIPPGYFKGSPAQRWALLQGMVDTDGYVMPDGHLDISTSSPQLAKDITALVQSLGGIAKTAIHRTERLPSHRVGITLPANTQPCTLERKLARFRNRQGKYNPTRAITAVEYIGLKEAQCISIDAEDGCYLTDNYTVTHNTWVAMAWAFYHPELWPVIITVPAQVKLQWSKAIQYWMGMPEDEIFICKGKTPRRIDRPLVLINYDILGAWERELARIQPGLVISDECHRLKNFKSARARVSTRIAYLDSVQSRLGLTGSMFMNRPVEGWSQVNYVNNQVFPSQWDYQQRYCNPKRIHTTAKRDSLGKVLKVDGEVQWNDSWDFKGASHLDELAGILKERVMIRHTDTGRPKVNPVPVPLECNLTDYRLIHAEAKARLKQVRDEMRARRLTWQMLEGRDLTKAVAEVAEGESLVRLYGLAGAEIAKLRVAAGLAKVEPAAAWLEDFLEEENPLLIFSRHHEVSDGIITKIQGKYGLTIPNALDGRMPMNRRYEAKDKFVNQEFPFLVAGIDAMSEGFDGLQYATSYLAFLELTWNKESHSQAEGRLDRRGQTKPVTSYYLIAVDTIDEQLARMIDAKGVVTSAAHGDDMPDPGILESLMDWIIGE